MRKIEDAIDKVREILTLKGGIYGPTYHKVASMLSVCPQYSILVRILEKSARIDNLLKQPTSQMLEQLQEEFIDIAAYAILAAYESSRTEENVELK